MNTFKKALPWIFLTLCVLMFAKDLIGNPYKDQLMDLNTFSQIPVLHQGRVKPLDSFARNNLKIISDKQIFRDEAGKKQPAIRWFMDVASGNEASRQHKVFRIEHDDVLTLMKLESRSGFRYSLEELRPQYPALIQQAQAASQKPDTARDLVDTKVLELYNQIEVYRRIASFEAPLVIPSAENGSDNWLPLGSEKQDLNLTTSANAWYTALKTYQNGNVAQFNANAKTYLNYLKKQQPELFPKIPMEQRFNITQPFYQAMIFFVLSFLLCVFSWMFWAESLNKSAFYVVLFTSVLFTLSLGVRMYLQGRPPVTNLYSSAIFVGWIAVLMGLGIEWFVKNGFGTVMTSITGFSALLVAQNLAGDGDTMEMMRAVLDTNFWLATHVTTVTMGYSASYLAGFMAIVLVVMGVFTRKLDKDLYGKISAMIYGTVAFATLFSFVGTVLGGIWADQSWGRFWGWDPKENGAVMIVLWNAIILHARWGGLAKRQGIALMAIGGNIITTWSWFGVNMLGVGLHSYGFTDSGFVSMVGFVLFNLLLICIGSLPEEMWRSFRSFASKSQLKKKDAAAQA